MLKALTSSRLVDPSQGLDQIGTILVDGETGTIVDIITADPPSDAEIIDLAEKMVAPGFIDLSCRPGSASPRSLAALGQAAVSGGYTAVAVFPDTIPSLTDSLRIAGLRSLAETNCPARVYPIGALSRNLNGSELADIGSLVEAGARALSDGYQWITSAKLLLLAFRYASTFERPLFVYPEDAGLAADGLVRESATATELGLPAIPAAAEEVAVARDLLLARASGGRLHFTALSTAGAVALLSQAQKLGSSATAAAPLANLLLTSEAAADYNTNSKLAPALGEAKDRAALLAGLEDGVLAAITTNHTPVAPEKKDMEFEAAAWGGSFLRHTFPLLYSELVCTGRLSLQTLVARLTSGPAAILGLGQSGTLQPGRPADLTVIDLKTNRLIRTDDLPANERNTPFADRRLSGWPVLTMVQGKIVYQR